jgi:hypothetical protein
MKNRMQQIIAIIALVFAINLGTAPVQAQCPMCKIAAESNMKNGGTAGKGLNNGILYMLVTPYLIVGAIAYFWWRNRKKEAELKEEELV